MAARKTTTATRTKVAPKPEPIVEEAVVAEEVAEEEEVVKEEVKKKSFKSTDGIKCTSITSGNLFMVGLKSGKLYSWLDSGDVVYVDYEDLVGEVRTRGMYAFRPRFVVDNQDFIDEFPELDTLYASLYSKRDLKQILALEPEQMRYIISGLPDGAKDAIKSMAVTMIERRELDSINRIKVIDEIFGTSMLLKMTS